jgi:predicted kinase
MMERAAGHLAKKRGVVLDATFLERRQRGLARDLAAAAGAPMLVAHVTAPEGVVGERLGARSGGASDARWDTYLAQRERFEPIDDVPEAQQVALDSTRPLDQLVDAALAAAMRGHSARRARA